MKSSKTKIVLSIVLVLFLVVFGGVYFYAKSQISPEKVREHTLAILKKSFPKNKVKLGKAELKFGLSINVEFDELKIGEGKKKLLELDNLNIKLPIFAILTGGGDLSVNLNSPKLYYSENKKSNNWTVALSPSSKKNSKNKNEKQKEKSSSSKDTSLAVPALLLNSTVSVNVRDLKVNYVLKDKSSGSVKLERVLLKKIGLNNSSAFEVKSSLDYRMKSKEKVKLDALLIGQFNLSEFISSGELETVSELTLKNVLVPGLRKQLPELKTKIVAHLKKNGNLNLDLDLSFLQQNKISLKVELAKKTVKINNINTSLVVKDLMSIAGVKIASVDPKKSTVSLNGSVYINSKGKIGPKLEFTIGPDLTFKDKHFTTSTTLKGSLKGRDFKSRAEAKVLDGTVVLQNSMKLDLNNPPTLDKLPKIFTLINVSNLSIKEGLIQELVYTPSKANTASKSSSSKEDSSAENPSSQGGVPLIPPGEVTIKMSNVKIDNRPFSLNSKIILSSSKIGIKKSKFSFSKGKGSIESLIKLKQGSTSGSFSFDLTKFDLVGLKPFLPKDILNAIHGAFSGKVDGSFAMRNSSTSYDVLTNLSARDGEIKGVNISKQIMPLLKKIPGDTKKYSKGLENIDGKFKTLSMSGRFTDKLYSIKNYRFIGVGNKVDLSGHGKISPLPTRRSELYATYKDPSGKLTRFLKKEAGTDKLQIKMKGNGFSLKPDINYTVKTLSKTAVKAQGKKQVDKFLKSDKNKKKLNKLLKGLFK